MFLNYLCIHLFIFICLVVAPVLGGPDPWAPYVRQRHVWKKYPYLTGTPIGLDTYGASYNSANAQQKANRIRDHFRGAGMYLGPGMYQGHGGFWDDLWGGIKNVAGDVWGAVKAPLIGLGHSYLNKFAGKGRYRSYRRYRRRGYGGYRRRRYGRRYYRGRGDYATNDIVGPASISDKQTFEPPQFAPTMDGIVISHKEYVQDIFGPPTQSFQNQALDINPGLQRTFPWLSQIAANFEEYEIKQLIFTYKSTVADFASSSGQVGEIIMVTNYNAQQNPFVDKRTMMEYKGAQSCKSSESLMSGVECDPRLNSGAPGKYVRTGPVREQQDINTYDIGKLNIAVANIPATYINQTLGELHVSYTVELRKHRLWANVGYAIPEDRYFCSKNPSTLFDPFSFSVTPPSTNKYLSGQQNMIGTALVPCPYMAQVPNYTPGPPIVLNEYPEHNVPVGARLMSKTYAVAGVFDLYPPVIVDNGTNVLKNNPMMAKIVFPAQFSGNIELSLEIECLEEFDLKDMVPNLYYVGNITPIIDIIQASGASGEYEYDAVEQHVGHTWIYGGSSKVASLSLKSHFNVAIATGGQDNIVYLALPRWEKVSGFYDAKINNAELSVRIYNTQFNYTQLSNNDTPIWVNATGSIVPLLNDP